MFAPVFNFELRSVMNSRYLFAPCAEDIVTSRRQRPRTLLARSFIPGTARALGKILQMLFSVAVLSGYV